MLRARVDWPPSLSVKGLAKADSGLASQGSASCGGGAPDGRGEWTPGGNVTSLVSLWEPPPQGGHVAGPPCSCPLGDRFLAALPLQVSLLWTALPPLPVEVANRTLPVPQKIGRAHV